MNLRKWQSKALHAVQEIRQGGVKKHALIAACPGAGKTRFTVAMWQTPDMSRGCDVIVVVGPSRLLKRQWKRAFESAGIGAIAEIGNGHLEQRAYRDDEMFDPERPAQVYTYAQVASNPALFGILCRRHKVLAIFDEIHHADDDAAYGRALELGFEDAAFVVSLTGTPFNTRGGRLAFCDTVQVTDDDGRKLNRTVTDFEYSYGDALSATGDSDDPEVVRPVQFVRWNGTARWQTMNIDTGEVKERSVDGSKKSDPLSPLVDIEGDYAKRMIDSALDRLSQIREHQSNAGMLITAMDREHCEQITKYLGSKGVRDVVMIMHDTPGAADKIRDFERGNQRVLVAIKMISEGVDIKRLRVGVYLSNVLTQMFFTQFIGRFIRWDGSISASQFACVFIPEHVTLIKYALEIERMVCEAEMADVGPDGPDGPGPDKPTTVWMNLESDGKENGVIEREQQIVADEAREIREALQRAGMASLFSEGQAKKFLDAIRSGAAPDSKFHKAQQFNESSLSKQNDKMVGVIERVSATSGRPMTFAQINAAANKAVGIKTKDVMTPESKLRERLDFLKGLLVRTREGGDAFVS
jgi:superfamily II DNA or RNA helicase